MMMMMMMMIGLPGASGTEEGTQPTHAQEDALLRTHAVRRTNLLAQTQISLTTTASMQMEKYANKNINRKCQQQTNNARMRTQAVRCTYLLRIWLKHRFF